MKENRDFFEPIMFESSQEFSSLSKGKASYKLEKVYFPKDGNKRFGFTTGVRVHFVGIGGIGMCGLAELLHHSGIFVTGSDLVENAQIQRLRELGISVSIGHKKENIENTEIIIQSSAVPENNIEIQTAQNRKLPIIKRSEALAEIMRLKRGLVVAGTHGKTTTTHLLAQIFIHNKKDPTVVIGGRSHLFQSTAFPGKGKWFIAESDESDGGFKSLSPEMAVITNIDRDHLDYYGSFEKLKSAFLDFVLKVPFYGCVVAWGDQPVLRDLLSNIEQKVIFYGFNPDNHFVLEKDKAQKYRVFINEQEMGLLNVPLPGSMNALNTLAACATAMTIGFSFEECSQSFLQFKGVDRRFHKKAELNPKGLVVTNSGKAVPPGEVEKQPKGLNQVNTESIEFYDDYAHHPTEVRAVLSAFREKFGKEKRLIVLFQPHRFSRTSDCWSHFLTCFKEADHVFLTDIYPAGETPMKGISSDVLAKEIQHPSCSYCSEADIFSVLLPILKGGDVFITMGAGSIYKYGDSLISQFRERCG
ncbi:MAG: UDP-N-acetylmuramate--L-alanine ligase [Bdellovibrionales bacterium]|nr:UDP-N-acetylmuramate--L-alanine ligase [Bdellovibrionales bacterium]